MSIGRDPSHRSAGARMEPSSARSPTARAVRWAVGWILLPFGILLLIFGFGVHWGASHPESWILAMTRWLADLVG